MLEVIRKLFKKEDSEEKAIEGWIALDEDTEEKEQIKENTPEKSVVPPKVGFKGKKVNLNPSTELKRKRNEGRMKNLREAIKVRTTKGLDRDEKTENLRKELERREHLKAYYDLGGE